MNNIDWIETTEDNLPDNGQRVVYYKPNMLSKLGEMIYLHTPKDKKHFLEEVSHWATEIQKPTQ